MLVSRDGQDFGVFLWGFVDFFFFIVVLGCFLFRFVFHCFNSFLYKAFSFLPNIPHFCFKKVLGQTLVYERNFIKTSGVFKTKRVWDGKSMIDLKSISFAILSWKKPRPMTCTRIHPQRSAATQMVPATNNKHIQEMIVYLAPISFQG